MNTIETDPSNNARVSRGWSRSWTHFKVDRRSPRYCHVTFDHPPINTITATTVAELSDLAGQIEHDPDLNVAGFDSANRATLAQAAFTWAVGCYTSSDLLGRGFTAPWRKRCGWQQRSVASRRRSRREA